MTTAKHQILILGGDTAGSRGPHAAQGLPRCRAVIEPSSTHYYQPPWRAALPDVAEPATSEPRSEHPIR